MHDHPHRDSGGCVEARERCKRSGRCEPLYEMSGGLDARWNIRGYIHILHQMLHSWALRSNPIDAGMRLPGKNSSLLC